VSIDARLNNVMPALSAKERASLILGSLKDGTTEDPKWRSTMPPSQTAEFNRLIGLMNGCNIYLSHLITRIAGLVDLLDLRIGWLATARLAEMQLDEVSGQLPKSRRPRQPVEIHWREGSTWAQLGDDLTELISKALPLRWREIRATEIVLDEVAREFDGEDPVKLLLRNELNRSRENALKLKSFLEGDGKEVAFSEPQDEEIELTRGLLERGAHL